MGNKVGKEFDENQDEEKEYEISFLQGRMSTMEIREKVTGEEFSTGLQTTKSKKEGGIVYFVGFEEKKSLPPPPQRLLHRPRIVNKAVEDLYDDDEKQLMTEILENDTMYNRGISATTREERHALARLRREEMARLKQKRHGTRMKAIEESRRRRDELLNQRRTASHSRSKLVSTSAHARKETYAEVTSKDLVSSSYTYVQRTSAT
ncbi:uncharacterized protein LOC110463183 [Mizuhopecten yessoensis]|uniref:Uncharacterized protein n=1 Tax=Mizuhopecten yessoensis TaxID=6573 RepID=A0A210R270_MIZYE|nr:uncharacterized protein LOC110463183 [Mizuhopecten yessoensis]OWF55183.1 hypothetical protein KP79_PYT20263 [Mizuhopecten yessoensis]